jgi:hypothetical protein
MPCASPPLVNIPIRFVMLSCSFVTCRRPEDMPSGRSAFDEFFVANRFYCKWI